MNCNSINSQILPKIYRRNGKECYLDNIRQKLIIITPEETVRQKVINFLINDLKVPSEMIRVEESLAEYTDNSRLRADIVIRKRVEDLDYVLAIIECKAPDVAIDDRGIQQLQNYCRELDAEYSMITNGYDFRFFYFDTKDFREMDDFPDYAEMLDGVIYNFTPPEPLRRIPYDSLWEYVRRFNEYRWNVIGDNSNWIIGMIGINLYEAFMDTTHKMPERKYSIFTLLSDYGVRNLTYGNASGGKYNGNYRSFLIQYHGSVEFVSFSILPYGHGEQTMIGVAIDDDKSAHHSLQYILDKHIVVENDDTVVFYHNGKIAVGNIGSAKVSNLQKIVRKKYPDILDENGFCLGSIKFDRLLNLDDEETVKFMENMISYALLRDDYRKILKKQKAESTK